MFSCQKQVTFIAPSQDMKIRILILCLCISSNVLDQDGHCVFHSTDGLGPWSDRGHVVYAYSVAHPAISRHSCKPQDLVSAVRELPLDGRGQTWKLPCTSFLSPGTGSWGVEILSEIFCLLINLFLFQNKYTKLQKLRFDDWAKNFSLRKDLKYKTCHGSSVSQLSVFFQKLLFTSILVFFVHLFMCKNLSVILSLCLFFLKTSFLATMRLTWGE